MEQFILSRLPTKKNVGRVILSRPMSGKKNVGRVIMLSRPTPNGKKKHPEIIHLFFLKCFTKKGEKDSTHKIETIVEIYEVPRTPMAEV